MNEQKIYGEEKFRKDIDDLWFSEEIEKDSAQFPS